VDVDSLGEYFSPPAGEELNTIGSNLLRFWILKDSTQVGIVGSSQVVSLSPSQFQNHKTVSLGWSASIHSDYDKVIRRYLVPNTPNLKYVIVTLMPGFLFPHGGGFPSPKWETSLAKTVGYSYDENHGFWGRSLPANFEKLAETKLITNGWVKVPPVQDIPGPGWGGDTPIMMTPINEDTTQAIYQNGMAILEGLTEYLSGRGIHLIILHCPENPAYANFPLAGYWGPSWPMFYAIKNRVEAWTKKNRYVHFYDANLDGRHDYSNDEFGNENHLAWRGGNKLAFRLDSLMSKIDSSK